MNNNVQNEFTIEELEARFEMETAVPGDDMQNPDGWYCRCGYEEK